MRPFFVFKFLQTYFLKNLLYGEKKLLFFTIMYCNMYGIQYILQALA